MRRLLRTGAHWFQAGSLPLAILLFYGLPALRFININFAELLLHEMIGVMAIALATGLVVWGLAALVLKDRNRGALLAVVASFPLMQYKSLYDLFDGLFAPFGDGAAASYVFFLLVIAGSGWLVHRMGPRRVATIGAYFAIVGLLLVGQTAYSYAKRTKANAGTSVTVDNADLKQARGKTPGKRPDIYYLIFDRYAGQVALTESYGFDNSKFLDGLRKRGFYVSEESFSNYYSTPHSIGSSLNGGLLTARGPVGRTTTKTPLFRLYERPAVAAFLKRHGYAYVQVGSWYTATGSSAYADENPQAAWEVGAFGHNLHLGYAKGSFLTTTMFGDAYDRYGGTRFSHYESHGDMFQGQMEKIEEQAVRTGPKFVFAHMLMPHRPIVFNAQGGRDIDEQLSDRQQYIEQLRYTNAVITRTVDRILAANRDHPPIIILAADEGEYPALFTPAGTDKQLREKTSIITAIHYPGREYGSLYDTITPVNYFRVTFNRFFGTDLERQPDRTFTKRAQSTPLYWADITERVHDVPETVKKNRR